MKHINLKIKIATGMLLVAVIMSGCSLLPGKGGGSLGGRSSGNRKHSDKYDDAEDYCEYWFGPCEEIGTHKLYEGSDTIVYEMKDTEFGFEYTVIQGEGKYYFSGSDFASYYIDEFLKSDELDDLAKEYDLEFENFRKGEIGSPTIRINCDRELSSEDNEKILKTVMSKLGDFDSERNVFNKKYDNIHVAIELWSAPWEHDINRGGNFHVENETFGDNYKEQ